MPYDAPENDDLSPTYDHWRRVRARFRNRALPYDATEDYDWCHY